MMRTASLSLAVVLAWLSVGASAEAQSAVQARFFDEAARSAYARGDYEAALADFFELARVAPSEGTLYNIALCADLTHRDALAYEALERYLAGPPDDDARTADARRRLSALESRVARVAITSSEPGATIWVDRRELGSFGETPRTLVLEAGPHVITLTHPRMHDAQLEVVAENGARREAHGAMTPRTGRLRVALEGASDAEVVAVRELEGSSASSPDETHVVTPGTPSELPVGSYRVTARRAGFVDVSLRVSVSEGVEVSRTLTLTARPRVVGVLVVRSDVPATVRVDGVDRAETPARIPGLDVGVHRVEVRAAGRTPWSGEVQITRDRARFVNVSLVPE